MNVMVIFVVELQSSMRVNLKVNENNRLIIDQIVLPLSSSALFDKSRCSIQLTVND